MHIYKKALILPYNNKGEILIQDRSNIRKKIRMNWGYFGGSIEKGETPIEAVIRETEEELGLRINWQELKFIGVIKDKPRPDTQIIRHAFLWKMNTDISKINLQEGKAMKFVSSNKVSDYMELKGDKELASKADELLKNDI